MKIDGMGEPVTLNDAQVQLLAVQSHATLAEWWNTLNTWGWVDALGPEEVPPKEWHSNTLRNALMYWIDTKLGMEYILRRCNVNIDKRMTDEEFTAWWGRKHS